jgi:tRNA threonylcarbamoyl adenosine modification protein YjeE
MGAEHSGAGRAGEAARAAGDRDAERRGENARATHEVVFTELDESGVATRGHALGGLLRAGDVVLLDGPMGAGKTTLTRAIARGLGVAHPDRVQSPTFTLCMLHRGPVPLAHVDLFRLGGEDDEAIGGAAGFDALGLDDLLADAGLYGEQAGPGVALIVEWGSRWRTAPADHLAIRLIRTSPDRRDLKAVARGPRAAELLSAWVSACASS